MSVSKIRIIYNFLKELLKRLSFFPNDYYNSNSRMIGSMMDSRYYIPEQVLFDILLRLPVASLLRFKCVCKSWCFLVESSTFITEHLRHSKSSEDALLVCSQNDLIFVGQDNHYDGKMMLISGNKYEKCSKLDYMPFPCNDRQMAGYTLVGSCDGIICLRTSRLGHVALCNPAMKQVRHLPEPLTLTPPIGARGSFDVVGFGFDFKSNDYKVVRIFFYKDIDSEIHDKIVEVYSKRTDSWRISHQKNASLPFELIDDPHLHARSKNGTCFWTGLGFDGECKLITFDLNDEVFGMMPLPDSELYDEGCALDFLNDNLVYIKGVDCDSIISMFDGGHIFFEIWMLHEFGAKESWNKIFKIGPIGPKKYFHFYYPQKLSKNGEFLVLMGCYITFGPGGGGLLRLYDLRSQDKYPLIYMPEDKYPLIHPPDVIGHEIFEYNESLVSIKS